MLRRRDVPALMLPFVAISCKRAASTNAESTTDRETARPDEAGFRTAELQKLSADIRAGQFPNTHAVLIERDGRLVCEQYFTGSDEIWGGAVENRTLVASSLHDLRSVSKSVTSALVGIALGKDFDQAVARPIRSFFPNRQLRPQLDAITLRHVLTMTAGFEWNEMTVPYTDSQNDEGRMYSVKDPIGFVLARPLRDAPGARWYYCSGLTMVLAGVIEQITGKSFDVFAREALFTPLGITDYEWLGSFDTNPRMPSAASGLRLRARSGPFWICLPSRRSVARPPDRPSRVGRTFHATSGFRRRPKGQLQQNHAHLRDGERGRELGLRLSMVGWPNGRS